MTGDAPLALVTGAGKGIGRAIAEQLARDGYELACWSRTPADLESLSGYFQSRRIPHVVQKVDVGDRQAVDSALNALMKERSAIDAVIVNAGFGRWRRFEDIALEDWRDELRTNLDGAFNCVSATLGYLLLGGKKSLIGVGSDASLYPFTGRASYAASKTGMRALFDVLRKEYRGKGLKVSMLYPGAVDTSFKGSYEKASPGTRPQALKPEHIARLVSFILSQDDMVELREIQVAALTGSYGPYPEKHEGGST